MSLQIIKRSSHSGNHMIADDLTVRFVHNPEMKVFARAGANGLLWPEVLKRNGQEYHYIENIPMPNATANHYSGYALYRIKEYKHGPITNEEFAVFLQAVAYIMRKNRSTLHDALEPESKQDQGDLLGYIQNSLEPDAVRAKYIFDVCGASMRGVQQPNSQAEDDNEPDEWDEEDKNES